jgi:hypothetical protein
MTDENISDRIAFFEDNIGSDVLISIGMVQWRPIRVLEVDKETQKLFYKADDIPNPTWMEVKHIEGFQQL